LTTVATKSIPNKIKNLTGITAEVNLLQEGDKHFIEIIIQPYSVPISLRGRYYYRSGSVKQELTGVALNEFLLKRAGHTWDDVIDERASLKKYLRKVEEAGRLPDTDGLSIPELLEKLQLAKKRTTQTRCNYTVWQSPRQFVP
jgi:ATP-dependent DNA helicase RecG